MWYEWTEWAVKADVWQSSVFELSGQWSSVKKKKKKKTTGNVRTCFILQTEERSTANRVTNNTDTVLFAISGLPSKAEAGHIRFCLIFMARVTLSRCNSIYSCDLFMLCLCDSAGGWPPSMVNLNTLDHHRSSSLWQEYISASRHDRSKQLENHNLALRHFCDSVDITTWKKRKSFFRGTTCAVSSKKHKW